MFGVVVLEEDDGLCRLVEKAVELPINLALLGVYAFLSCVHEAMTGLRPRGTVLTLVIMT